MEKVLVFLLSFSSFLFADFAVQSLQEIRSKGVVRQNYEESCGASALATLINLWDSTQFSEMDIIQYLSANEAEKNTNMVSFLELENVLHALEYQVKSYRIHRDSFLKTSFPMLVKIEDDPRFPHFVVVINHEGDYLSVFDPSYGVYVSTKQEFFSIWDKDHKGGYALLIAPKTEHFKGYAPIFPNKRVFE